MQAIADTRFVPEKGRNRLGSMVEQRPDWVISRQRAWGVPIALFVEKKTGELLVDTMVNHRIIAAVSTDGVDAWSEENAPEFLGPERNPDDYEMVGDILDVWFDSGCTHVFTLESGHWPDQRWPADLYLEGSDQHRGWFQSSLLESCGTRGRAPYNAVLTHGFTMDARGMKMSKSLGNTVDPLKVMETYGADIIRLWALSVDFTEDHRIGDEILGGVADQYRKLRNTFRYLLGALADFREEEKVGVDAMPELELYVLHLTAELEAKLKTIVDFDKDKHWSKDEEELFDFTSYVRLLVDFANNDLSAFYFDIRKDVLYCEVNAETGAQTDRRRAYRTVLDTLFHALVRWLSPVLVFTAEEVWGTRYGDGGSVHLLEWPEVPAVDADEAKWAALRELRERVTEAIEPLRRDKVLGSSLEAEVTVPSAADPELLAELFITSTVRKGDEIEVTKTANHKCGRCWRYLPEVKADGELCGRCEDVVNG
jgi:isoleucyl-tRNA synthetase